MYMLISSRLLSRILGFIGGFVPPHDGPHLHDVKVFTATMLATLYITYKNKKALFGGWGGGVSCT